MSKYFIVEGPRTIGNVFGHFGHELPEGRFAVCENGEYSNGGFGPSQVFLGLFSSREEAEAALSEYETFPEHRCYSVTTSNGQGAYCEICGKTLA